MSDNPNQSGGIIHTYLKYDPVQFPSPNAPPADAVSPAFEHMLRYGTTRNFTEEQLANAIRIDPSQIQGFGPSMERMMDILEERKKKILETYETESVQKEAHSAYKKTHKKVKLPGALGKDFQKAFSEEQLVLLESIWYQAGGEKSEQSVKILEAIERLGEKYQIDELAAKYSFTGNQVMSVEEALMIKMELEKIDKLLQQLKDALQNAQLALVDLEELSEFVGMQEIQKLDDIQKQIQEYLKAIQESQGIEKDRKGLRLTPKSFRIFQSKLLQRIFSELKSSRTGRHSGPIDGEGAVETQKTKMFELGDSLANLDVVSSFVNLLVRSGGRKPENFALEDLIVHRTKNNPKCATAVLLDMSGSMRNGGIYVDVKRMGLALDGLIRSEFPGDRIHFIEMFTFGRVRSVSEIPQLMPKPVTIFDPVVRLRADMSDPEISEMDIPPHFTNIQHSLQQARTLLANSDTVNRQVILITDGMPTAHFEGKDLYLLYPPDPKTEAATIREAVLCARDGITINIFLLSSWNQTSEDVQFAYKMARLTNGRVIFVAGKDLDRFVVWDYLSQKKTILG